eukprot:scpid29278/ scgid18047/ 
MICFACTVCLVLFTAELCRGCTGNIAFPQKGHPVVGQSCSRTASSSRASWRAGITAPTAEQFLVKTGHVRTARPTTPVNWHLSPALAYMSHCRACHSVCVCVRTEGNIINLECPDWLVH